MKIRTPKGAIMYTREAHQAVIDKKYDSFIDAKKAMKHDDWDYNCPLCQHFKQCSNCPWKIINEDNCHDYRTNPEVQIQRLNNWINILKIIDINDIITLKIEIDRYIENHSLVYATSEMLGRYLNEKGILPATALRYGYTLRRLLRLGLIKRAEKYNGRWRIYHSSYNDLYYGRTKRS